ncbi:6831_t:CDS:10 [Entrophospora sp. SA101]|nr:6831_t:CDS:10 [Entrophospora sp. SA101]
MKANHIKSFPNAPNTLNRPAQASQSLYPSCVDLLDRLYCVEGFEEYLKHVKDNMQADGSIVGTPTSENGQKGSIPNDPITLLWKTFRLGYPLCALFNTLQTSKPLNVIIEDSKPGGSIKANKASVYHFLVACQAQLEFEQDDIFTITQLYQDDTNGFVKVINTVKLVIDKIEEKGLLNMSKRHTLRNSDPTKPTDNRARVVHELLETERKYVQDMEALQIKDIVSADTIHLLFANLNQLVDFQRRFLIRVEANASLPPSEQRFGILFIQMVKNIYAFTVYEPFCANYQSASELIIKEKPNLQKLANKVEPTYELPSLLIKPIQRICKYPLLLQELLKFTDSNETQFYDEIQQGLLAIKRVADRVNETRRKQENDAIVKDLESRVEDWKGHKITTFKDLHLEDVFIMSKDDTEREYHVYLFERIILCCKEIQKKSQTKPKGILKDGKKSKKPSLQLKGRIYIHNISAIVNNSRQGLWSLKIFWKGDSELDSFSLKCRNEEQLKLWQTTIEKLQNESSNRNTLISSNIHSKNSSEPNSTPVKHKIAKSQSLPYGQPPATPYGGNGKSRPRTEEQTPLPPYNWNSSQPLPSNAHRTHGNTSMPPIPRSSNSSMMTATNTTTTTVSTSTSTSPTMTPPSSYHTSPAQSARSSTSTSNSNSVNTWSRRSIEQPSALADTLAKVMMSEEDDYVTSTSMQRAHSHNTPPPTDQQTYQNVNGSIIAQQQQQQAANSILRNQRLRSASTPNIHSIQESSFESGEPLPELPASPPSSNNNVIKVNYADEIFVIVVPQNIEYRELCERIERKIRLCSTRRDESIPLRKLIARGNCVNLYVS